MIKLIKVKEKCKRMWCRGCKTSYSTSDVPKNAIYLPKTKVYLNYIKCKSGE